MEMVDRGDWISNREWAEEAALNRARVTRTKFGTGLCVSFLSLFGRSGARAARAARVCQARTNLTD